MLDDWKGESLIRCKPDVEEKIVTVAERERQIKLEIAEVKRKKTRFRREKVAKLLAQNKTPVEISEILSENKTLIYCDIKRLATNERNRKTPLKK